ncbi:GNAT family N-acetyltransferase [Defluviitalea raffinosedens]|jgi:ribosomal protein S18 acetylase RimI-like enzyme|uniref:GNAT family N-acetyltransferase n=1 Tax=Defluviitalea raffinosedens TaxID=1450156 RepID=A0A7C8LEZ6_9FIRM|nr:GNAT family N-acetyltransferase [Defluviitalea raffinosedens]KAE9634932.1 GNAT family N-acetyltransferase [Defluviitalea raffinosedens]MBM7685724.1 ribosomal protein S18 acetylase RimI-like enzyme [Defluviitalea raffinosedens]MBZ4667480.1 family acetyltransferase YhhY [Defluviitaleaceae bacterium]HHW66566.1 GNAT family N-acetyltransferase [Candidatus Epulonipiscium sp.]
MKDESIIIVQAKADYVESYNRAVDIVARERKYLASTKGFSLESTRSFVEAIEQNNLAQFYAIRNGMVIGWCDILPKNFEGFEHVGTLGMGVLPEYRGIGLGSHLLERAIEHAKAINGIEKVELEVFESNENALKFYQKHGFFQEGRRVKSRKLDGQYDNIILMGRFI